MMSLIQNTPVPGRSVLKTTTLTNKVAVRIPYRRHHRIERSHVYRSSSDSSSSYAAGEPVDARGAIATGLKLTEQGEWTKGLEYFERALELPGTGLKRFRDKPNLISNGEKMAALYNIACCQSRMAETTEDEEERAACIQNGLVALAGALEAGYDDFEQLDRDEDFTMLKTSEKFQGLVGGFQRKAQGLFGSLSLFGSKKA